MSGLSWADAQARGFSPAEYQKLWEFEAADPAPESFDATAALRRVMALADEMANGTSASYGLGVAAGRIRAAIAGGD